MIRSSRKLTSVRITSKPISILTAITILICLAPCFASAAAPPASLDAPPHFGVTYNSGSSFNLYISASDSIRDYIARQVQDNPDDPYSGGITLYYQVDAKINNGSWQYTSAWDSPKTVPDSQKNRYYIPCRHGECYAGSGVAYLSHLFSDEAVINAISDSGWDYFSSNTITFRARFAQSFDNGDTYVLSPWSKEFVLSANVKLDAEKMINHAPTLKGAEISMHGDTPLLAVKLDKPPQDIGDLNAAAGGSIGAEIWLRKQGDKDFKNIHYWWVSNESIEFKTANYFDDYKDHYEEAAYEIKVRYFLDLRKYRQSGHYNSSNAVNIYSPFSNVISHNIPAWSNASSWATEELKKADDSGLIPEILKGADLTKPITREEFCELALLLYEKTTGKSPAPASSNPFTDTNNPQILKAFALGITQGTSATTFSPQVLINREQCATMLFRTIKAIHPDGDYSIAGIKDFPDQEDISSFAVEGTKFMSKLGIIKGDNNGNFMPKAITPAQTAAGYGMATREAALLMGVRTYDKMDEIKVSSGDTTSGNTSSSIAGTWVMGTLTGGNFNAKTGKYEGGMSGLGMMYTFNPDGTYTALAIWSEAIWITGRYSIKDGVLTLTNRTSENSDDNGKTWGTKETILDASAYFDVGTDESGKYLLLGEEGAAPPLTDKKNALKYSLKELSQSQEKTTGESQKSTPSIIGIWQNGGMIGHTFDVTKGTFRYNSGVGQRYVFKEDGTFTSSIVSGYGNMASIIGTYTVKDDKIFFLNQRSKVSNDYGDTWKEGNAPPDISYYYVFETDNSDAFLIIGLEDVVPPLDTETNAVRYSLMDE